MNIYPAISVVQSNPRASNTSDFITKSKSIHGELYNYTYTKYKNARTKVKIECKTHGIFEQSPNVHLSGKRCKLCYGILVSNSDEFIRKARLVHGDFYNYEFVNYINARTKVKIECKIHGIFEQTAAGHLAKRGCKQCKHIISKISTKWLETLEVSDMICEYRLPENKYKAVDGYSPSTNTVYQFHGDYWHGNPLKFDANEINKTLKKTHGELYEKTIESDLWILSLGYNLVTMWESDFTYQYIKTSTS